MEDKKLLAENEFKQVRAVHRETGLRRIGSVVSSVAKSERALRAACHSEYVSLAAANSVELEEDEEVIVLDQSSTPKSAVLKAKNPQTQKMARIVLDGVEGLTDEKRRTLHWVIENLAWSDLRIFKSHQGDLDGILEMIARRDAVAEEQAAELVQLQKRQLSIDALLGEISDLRRTVEESSVASKYAQIRLPSQNQGRIRRPDSEGCPDFLLQ